MERVVMQHVSVRHEQAMINCFKYSQSWTLSIESSTLEDVSTILDGLIDMVDNTG